jgi:hypothetical protein
MATTDNFQNGLEALIVASLVADAVTTKGRT